MHRQSCQPKPSANQSGIKPSRAFIAMIVKAIATLRIATNNATHGGGAQ
jgi:hypothetical protein